VQEHVRAKMPEWRLKFDGVENMTLAVMGLRGQWDQASPSTQNIGISLPGDR
jgi:(E)-4-hydroxy-3-methylbut-2-enyl-diphosphate synthase